MASHLFPPEFLYLDIACQRTAEEVGGFSPSSMKERRIAVATTWNNNQPLHRIYYEHEFEELVNELESARVVVGYNCHNFDFEIIRGYCAVSPRRTLDLLADLRHRTGHSLSKGAVLKGTFGDEFPAEDPLKRIQWWKEERFQLVAESIARSVGHIRTIHEFGLAHGYVRYVDRFDQVKKAKVDWRM